MALIISNFRKRGGGGDAFGKTGALSVTKQTEGLSGELWRQSRLLVVVGFFFLPPPPPDVSAKQGALSRKLGGDGDLAEINTISMGSLMGQKTHLIAGCHNAFGHIGPRRDIHVTSAAAPRRQSAVRGSDRPSRLTVSDSYLGRALPHQSSPQGQSEVTGAPAT